MKRGNMHHRSLPAYTPGEEAWNAISHGIGAVLSIPATVLCLFRAASHENTYGMIAAAIYGFSLLAVFAVSCIYHGLKPCFAKTVLRIIDHCTIYLLIAGSYTVIVLSAIRPAFPALGWGLFFFEWVMGAVAICLTAIDLEKYSLFSMLCYVGMGWAVIPSWRQVLQVMGHVGFLLLLSGGIAYTIGAVLYGIGKRRKWMHSIFHLFVLLGALLQFFSIIGYAL